MSRWLRRSSILALATCMAVVALQSAGATTTYFPGTNMWGKTYRSNYTGSGCYDHYGSTSACYQGTWAETFYAGATVGIAERPQVWVPTLPGNYGGPFYWEQKDDIYNTGTSDTAVSSDYDALFDHRSDASAYTTHSDLDTLTYISTYDE